MRLCHYCHARGEGAGFGGPPPPYPLLWLLPRGFSCQLLTYYADNAYYGETVPLPVGAGVGTVGADTKEAVGETTGMGDAVPLMLLTCMGDAVPLMLAAAAF